MLTSLLSISLLAIADLASYKLYTGYIGPKSQQGGNQTKFTCKTMRTCANESAAACDERAWCHSFTIVHARGHKPSQSAALYAADASQSYQHPNYDLWAKGSAVPPPSHYANCSACGFEAMCTSADTPGDCHWCPDTEGSTKCLGKGIACPSEPTPPPHPGPSDSYRKVASSDCNKYDVKPQPSCGGNRNLSVAVLKACCDSTHGCGGFNTHGVIKDTACAAHVNHSPTTDLYLKTTAQPAGPPPMPWPFPNHVQMVHPDETLP